MKSQGNNWTHESVKGHVRWILPSSEAPNLRTLGLASLVRGPLISLIVGSRFVGRPLVNENCDSSLYGSVLRAPNTIWASTCIRRAWKPQKSNVFALPMK